MTTASKPRLLIFVVAYFAEESLGSVLERIPESVFAEYECRVLIVDDASTDRTREIGLQYRHTHPHLGLTVLRNEYNQGYGGNQKVGYTYAIREGFDFVALLHGDGQYAPEVLPLLVAPIRNGDADVVMGSRMMSGASALRGGMPLYKFVGNRILSFLQNRLLRTRLSEFHSGYRVYRVESLKRVQFRLNTNVFHFDTEIIIQLLNARQRFVEVPIPTYYGNEICRVDGMKYAKDVMFATLRSVLHRAGLLYQRRFDPIAEQDNQHYDLKLGYASSHQFALDAVPAGASVLDLGSGPGELALELLKKQCRVGVVDQFEPTLLAGRGDVRFFRQDLDDEPTFDLRDYQVVLLLDVIEHLKNPERFLERLRAQCDHTPRTVVLTTPNVAFVVQRLMLMVGQFNYGKAGILDRTHTRLFTFRSLQQLLDDVGLRVRRIDGVPAPFPKVFGTGRPGRMALQINKWLIRLSRSLFSYQIFVVAETTPDVDFLLDDARRRQALPVQSQSIGV